MSTKELQARIDKISTDIERQKEVLQDLERSKSVAQRQLNAIRDPVARLPLEISSEIFIQCLPLLPEPGAHNIPMLLLNICNTWTDLALSTPALWDSIRVVSPRAEGFPELLRIWLQRACNRPLSVSLTNTFHQGVIPIIWQHSQRLKHLEICYKQEEDGGNSDEDRDGEIDISQFTNLGPLPLLETLIIRHSAYADEAPTYRGSQIIDILRLAPNLVECVLDCVHPGGYAIDDVQEPLVLPTLRRLMFAKDGEFPFSDDGILTHLSIPRLEALTLSMRGISFADVLLFLKRSSPPLQQLVLGDGVNYGRVDQLVECLHLVPTVTHFELWYPESGVEGVFTFLAETPPRLLPNLQSLTIRPDSRISDSVWETLLSALVVRRTQIQIVHIAVQPPLMINLILL
ncbi:hypothetical protein B0H11DRAFT_2289356 [Mycena galericulata]|nr:hypothetical protein B0H11DRAFT_2289356 [Mycena galericulata]